MSSSQHVYEIRPRKDRRGFDLIGDRLPLGLLWFEGPDAFGDAVSYANTVDDRPKNFLTEAEMGNFLKAARRGRHSVRNFAMLLLAFRHGLRVSELINIRMPDLDIDSGRLF